MKKKVGKNNFIEQIFEKYYKDIYKFIYFRTGYNTSLAEDLTSEIFIKLLEHIDSFDESKSKLKTWIFTITRNHLIDYFRRKKISTVQLNSKQIINSLSKDNLQKIEEDLMIIEILKNLNKLKNEEKEIILYRYMHELTIQEISKIFNITKNNTKVKLHRAIKKLKQLTKSHDNNTR